MVVAKDEFVDKCVVMIASWLTMDEDVLALIEGLLSCWRLLRYYLTVLEVVRMDDKRSVLLYATHWQF